MNLPPMNNHLRERLRKDLQANGFIVKFVQLVVGVLFGIAEGILINMATGASGETQTKLYIWLGVVGFIHLILFSLALFSTTPLPQFLVDFDDVSESLQKSKSETEAYASFTETYNAAIIATQLSLSAIEARRLDPRNKIDTVLAEVIAPWLESRTEIFRFHDGSALYNFAVYEQSEQTKKLKSIWRSYDNRLKVRNREWEPGFGHVGVCFQRGKTLFSDDASAVGDDNAITTDVAEDKLQYRSMLSTPILIDGVKKGVFVVTSSKPHQFDKELHSPIVEIIAMLLGQAMKHGWTKNRQNP